MALFKESAITKHALGGTSMDRRGYNLLIGLLLVGGFMMLAFTSWVVLQPAAAAVISNNGMVFGIVTAVASLVGMGSIIFGQIKQNLGLMSLGYVLFTLGFGATSSVWLPRYGIDTITNAFVATAAVCVSFAILGMLFPRIFEKLVVVAIVTLLVAVLAGFVMAIMGISTSWIDFVTVGVFAIFIGYDVHQASMLEANPFNAVLSATNIFIDIVNVFMSLLSILDND